MTQIPRVSLSHVLQCISLAEARLLATMHPTAREARAELECLLGTMTQIREALAALLEEVDGTTCRHETTYRIRQWTLCRECSMAWADDRGGFVPYADSPAVAQARAALAAPAAARPLPEREDTLLRDYGK